MAQLKNSLTPSSHPMPLVAIVGNKADLVHLRQVSSEEGEILCTEYSELMTSFLGEISAADQMLGHLFVDLFKWLKRTKSQHKAAMSLMDRVVIGIKGGSSNGS
jgi:Ras-like protein family protein 11A